MSSKNSTQPLFFLSPGMPFSVFLAPMAGVCDPVFRALCRRHGAALTYTEMISAKGLAHGNAKTGEMLAALPADTPFAVQLFGTDPQEMAAQAHALEQGLGRDLALIDLNMGCPARKVAGKGGGAALMTQPALAERIISAVAGAVSVPVTVKFRKGFALEENTAVAFGRMAEAAGAAAVAVHGRTAAQLYRGAADRLVVEEVAQALQIPVIASGDVYTSDDIADYRLRGAAAVMVARGARGNPWIFAGASPSLEERVAGARAHVLGLAAHDPAKLVWMRKHLPWYFKGCPGAALLRNAVQTAHCANDYLALLEAYSCAVAKA